VPTPDPSVLPLAVWVVGTDATPVVQQLLDTLLLGFGVVVSLLAALLVSSGLRRSA
jgi:hypothetical protein